MKQVFILLLIVTILCAGTRAARACASFMIKSPDGVVMAKNLDWRFGAGMVTVNKRNVVKSSFFLFNSDAGTSWVSRYGSVTFNQHGREMPLGGINEKGLMIEVLWLDEASYPEKDDRPAVGVLQWVQYQLDTHASTAEVIADAEKIRVERSKFPLHYFVCDASGACAVLEYLKGRLVIHAGGSLPIAAITNDTYEKSIASLPRYAGFGGRRLIPRGSSSLARFARVAEGVRAYDAAKGAPVAYAFSVLDGVWQRDDLLGDNTTWQIVYEPAARRVHFRTAVRREIMTVDFAAFDYSCASPVQVLDMNARAGFRDYEAEANRALVKASLAKAMEVPGFLAGPLLRWTKAGDVADTTRCLETQPAPKRGPAAEQLEGASDLKNWH